MLSDNGAAMMPPTLFVALFVGILADLTLLTPVWVPLCTFPHLFGQFQIPVESRKKRPGSLAETPKLPRSGGLRSVAAAQNCLCSLRFSTIAQ